MTRGRKWTSTDTARLRLLAARGLTLRQIADCMTRDSRHVNERATRHGIEVRRVLRRHHWTSTEETELRELFPRHSAQEIADRLHVGVPAIHNHAHKLGLRKSRGWKSERTAQRWLEGRHEASRAHCFSPGHVPANKGARHPGWAPGRMARTQFKKGRPAHEARNYVPIGSLRISKDGYLERKVTDDPRLVPARRWVGVHRLVWQVAHGPIPRGHIVVFRPGAHSQDVAEITTDKLELITRQENMRRNSYHNYPQPIPQLIQLRGALTRKINKRIKA